MPGGRRFTITADNEEQLKKTLMQLRGGSTLVISGSGIIVRVQPGARRLFAPTIPTNYPGSPDKLSQRSYRSATEAAASLMAMHNEITKGQAASAAPVEK
jgi:hypothetical protein